MGDHECRGCGRMILMYEDGHSTLVIARETLSASATVTKYLRLHGIQIRAKGRPTGRPLSQKNTVMAVALYEQGATAAAIGKELNVSRERARQILIAAMGSDYQAYRPRGHRCTDLCAAVQASQGETFITIAMRLGVSWNRVSLAARHHGITGGSRHQCNERCAAVRAALDTETTIRQVVLSTFGSQWSKGHISVYLTNTKSYHPDWPWYDGRTRGGGTRGHRHHECGERCQAIRRGLEAGITPYRTARTVLGLRDSAAGNLAANTKSRHPDWPWPKRRIAELEVAS